MSLTKSDLRNITIIMDKLVKKHTDQLYEDIINEVEDMIVESFNNNSVISEKRVNKTETFKENDNISKMNLPSNIKNILQDTQPLNEDQEILESSKKSTAGIEKIDWSDKAHLWQ